MSHDTFRLRLATLKYGIRRQSIISFKLFKTIHVMRENIGFRLPGVEGWNAAQTTDDPRQPYGLEA
uniref:Uncharacterized protein n=1 Tax=Moniliophthora roreri TaxID=221103 RepID=A0A0W0G6H8_MONRR